MSHTFGAQVNKATLYSLGAAMGLDEVKLSAGKFTTPELVQLLLEQAKTLRQAAVRRIRVKRCDFQRVVTEGKPDVSSVERTVGILARIDVPLPYGDKGLSIVNRFDSPGFWLGVRDDTEETYLSEVFKEESDYLEHMLTMLGVEVVR